MDILIKQEIALHQHEIRQSLKDIQRLIHPNFREVGESGNSYNYNNIMSMMEKELPPLGRLHSQDYECVHIEPSVKLLMYRTCWISELGEMTHWTKRSSIWVFTGDKWQMKYHQGTPCPSFEPVFAEQQKFLERQPQVVNL